MAEAGASVIFERGGLLERADLLLSVRGPSHEETLKSETQRHMHQHDGPLPGKNDGRTVARPGGFLDQPGNDPPDQPGSENGRSEFAGQLGRIRGRRNGGLATAKTSR